MGELKELEEILHASVDGWDADPIEIDALLKEYTAQANNEKSFDIKIFLKSNTKSRYGFRIFAKSYEDAAKLMKKVADLKGSNLKTWEITPSTKETKRIFDIMADPVWKTNKMPLKIKCDFTWLLLSALGKKEKPFCDAVLDIADLISVAKYYGCSVDYILALTDKKEANK